MTILVLHDKVKARGHRQGDINARCGRFVAVSSDGLKVAKFDDSKITFRKRPFPAPWRGSVWARGPR